MQVIENGREEAERYTKRFYIHYFSCVFLGVAMHSIVLEARSAPPWRRCRGNDPGSATKHIPVILVPTSNA
jgi:hypothetical protein